MAIATKVEHSVEGEAATLWTEIDARLSKILQDPSLVVGPDGVAPSDVSIRAAIRVCSLLQFLAHEAPAAVVPDSDGGMILEWQHGAESRWIEISEAGQMEQVLIRDGQRVFRRVFEI